MGLENWVCHDQLFYRQRTDQFLKVVMNAHPMKPEVVNVSSSQVFQSPDLADHRVTGSQQVIVKQNILAFHVLPNILIFVKKAQSWLAPE